MNGNTERFVEEFVIDLKMSAVERYKDVFGRKKKFVERILVERAAEFGLKFKPAKVSKRMQKRIKIRVIDSMVYFVIVDDEGIHRAILEMNDYYFPVLSRSDICNTECVLKGNWKKYRFRYSKLNKVLEAKE